MKAKFTVILVLLFSPTYLLGLPPGETAGAEQPAPARPVPKNPAIATLRAGSFGQLPYAQEPVDPTTTDSDRKTRSRKIAADAKSQTMNAYVLHTQLAKARKAKEELARLAARRSASATDLAAMDAPGGSGEEPA